MKADDFEQQMQKQPLREIPPEWRESILRNAQEATEGSPVPVSKFERWRTKIGATDWRELFWPSPLAWSGLAAVWLVLLVLNQQSSNTAAPMAVQRQAEHLTAQTIMALQQQRRFRAELIEAPQAESLPAQPTSAPRTEYQPETATT